MPQYTHPSDRMRTAWGVMTIIPWHVAGTYRVSVTGPGWTPSTQPQPLPSTIEDQAWFDMRIRDGWSVLHNPRIALPEGV